MKRDNDQFYNPGIDSGDQALADAPSHDSQAKRQKHSEEKVSASALKQKLTELSAALKAYLPLMSAAFNKQVTPSDEDYRTLKHIRAHYTVTLNAWRFATVDDDPKPSRLSHFIDMLMIDVFLMLYDTTTPSDRLLHFIITTLDSAERYLYRRYMLSTDPNTLEDISVAELSMMLKLLTVFTERHQKDISDDVLEDIQNIQVQLGVVLYHSADPIEALEAKFEGAKLGPLPELLKYIALLEKKDRTYITPVLDVFLTLVAGATEVVMRNDSKSDDRYVADEVLYVMLSEYLPKIASVVLDDPDRLRTWVCQSEENKGLWAYFMTALVYAEKVFLDAPLTRRAYSQASLPVSTFITLSDILELAPIEDKVYTFLTQVIVPNLKRYNTKQNATGHEAVAAVRVSLDLSFIMPNDVLELPLVFAERHAIWLRKAVHDVIQHYRADDTEQGQTIANLYELVDVMLGGSKKTPEQRLEILEPYQREETWTSLLAEIDASEGDTDFYNPINKIFEYMQCLQYNQNEKVRDIFTNIVREIEVANALNEIKSAFESAEKTHGVKIQKTLLAQVAELQKQLAQEKAAHADTRTALEALQAENESLRSPRKRDVNIPDNWSPKKFKLHTPTPPRPTRSGSMGRVSTEEESSAKLGPAIPMRGLI